jgi:hypothetical protein
MEGQALQRIVWKSPTTFYMWGLIPLNQQRIEYRNTIGSVGNVTVRVAPIEVREKHPLLGLSSISSTR